jgi:hypothetical protein
MKRSKTLWWKFKDLMIILAFFGMMLLALAIIVAVPIVTINLLQNLF